MKKPPSPFDVSVGQRIKHFRVLRGLSQEKVADKLDLTFQQVQKYEKGVNRIGPSRLNLLSKLFNVPVAAFFGEDNKGDTVEIETMINSKTRRDLIRELERINSAKFETMMLSLAREYK